jgi:hypothetical protein
VHFSIQARHSPPKVQLAREKADFIKRKRDIFGSSETFRNRTPTLPYTRRLFLNRVILMIVIAIRLVFFKNQHNRSFEHKRARKRPTTTGEANDP